jgi:pyruvate/2-oxoglutarate dehydrogenase complex dihydrolipoamide acyltransferase (E2) component
MDPEHEHGESPPASDPPRLPAVEPAAPPETAPPTATAAPPDADSAGAGTDANPAPDSARQSEPDPADTLSPAVRRLVRQYDLDITGVHGSGPAGKIRVGDIIGMLDGRAEPRARTGEAPGRASAGAADTGARHAMSGPPREARVASGETDRTSAASSAATGAPHAVPTTTVFECDVSRVLSHRKRERRGDVELLLASYFIASCQEALHAVPEIAASPPDSTASDSGGPSPRLGVLLATTDGSVRRALVGTAAATLDERLRAIDAQLRASVDDDLHPAHVLIHYYGASGSLLATPTAIGAGHVGSMGIGRVRREIVVRTIDGQEAPRVTALCYLTLTFRPERIALERANRFVGAWVRVLEQWPVEPASTA